MDAHAFARVVAERVMAHRTLFSTRNAAPVADAVNQAGGRAYALSDKHALAQYAATRGDRPLIA